MFIINLQYTTTLSEKKQKREKIVFILASASSFPSGKEKRVELFRYHHLKKYVKLPLKRIFGLGEEECL